MSCADPKLVVYGSKQHEGHVVIYCNLCHDWMTITKGSVDKIRARFISFEIAHAKCGESEKGS